jgi:hypothetical protein
MPSVHTETEYANDSEDNNQRQTDIDNQLGAKSDFILLHCLARNLYMYLPAGTAFDKPCHNRPIIQPNGFLSDG